MKKSIYLCAIVLLLTHVNQAQERPSPWFPEGAEWYYGLFGEGELLGGTGCVHMTVAKDTLLADRLCKQLRLEACDGAYETLYEYVYPCGDSLFYYNYAAQDFFLLLNMAAKKGDTIWVHRPGSIFTPNPGFDPYRRGYSAETNVVVYRIINIDTVVMAGQFLRRQQAEQIWYNEDHMVPLWGFPGGNNNNGYIVEGIGSMAYFFGETELVYPEMGSYRMSCFFAEGKAYQTDGKCTNAAAETPLDNPAAYWRLSPQPASESVRAVCEASADGTWREGRWRLVDASGKALQGGVFTDGCFEISLYDRPAGLYFVEITATDGSACRLKCLKATR